jgi:FeS assembly SUF system regulator
LGTIYNVPNQSEFGIRPKSGIEEAMIILSKLADYGVIVATHLAAFPDRQVTAGAVAGATRLPQATVAKLLKSMAHAGLVTATRGASGGYRLARAAKAISVAEVVAAIDGDIGLTQCSVHVDECARTTYCPTRPHWAAINRAVGQALAAVSLDAMVTPAAFVPRMPTRATSPEPDATRYSA